MVSQRDDALCFVQFMHPGGEHRPDWGCFKAWNRDDHKRKFLASPGRCVRHRKVNRTELVFWGEWEPESEVVCRIERPLPHYPRYVYRPFYVVPGSYKGLQNTDPFVFGGFFYGNCLQHRKGKPTQLCFLERGSVIIFGSCVSGQFLLDTVFVVRDWIDYDCGSYQSRLRGRVPRGYVEVVLNPLCLSGCGRDEGCPPDKGAPYRLYRGVTYTDRDRFDGMFSFFPCMPRDERCKGFKHPVIKIPGTITDNLHMGFRLNCNVDKSQICGLWRSVVHQVLKKDLWLGIEAQMPERPRPPGRAALAALQTG